MSACAASCMASGVEPCRHPPGPVPLQRRRRPAVENAVEIVPGGRGKAGVEVIGRAAGGEHGHRLPRHPQMRVNASRTVSAGQSLARSTCATWPAHARRHRCGRRRAARRARRRSRGRPAPAPPAPNAGRPAAASRHRACRHIRHPGDSAACARRPEVRPRARR